MGKPIIEVDLHGLFQDEAVKVIDRALKTQTEALIRSN